MRRFLTIAALVILASAGAAAQQLIDAFEVVNRSTGAQAILIDSFAIVRRDAKPAFDPRQLRLRRCDTKAEVPFYLEPWPQGADSVMCWVRLENVPGEDTTIILVELDPALTVSRSNGSAVFLNFRDSSSVPAAGPNGPWALGSGAKPDFGRGLYIDARITARAATGGYLCYFGADATGTNGYVIKHEARTGNTDPDHLRINGGGATPLSSGTDPATYVWNVGETVRYNVLVTGTTNSVYRFSEKVATRRHRAIATRDAGLEWTMFGVASMAAAPQDLNVSFIRSRPVYNLRPRTTRKGAAIASTPSDAVICNGTSIKLSSPGVNWKTIKWSSGETTPTITVTAPGSYYADLSDGSGCTVRTQAFSVNAGSKPEAGNDTTITLCLGRTETLKVKPGYASYAWYLSWALKRTTLPFTGPTADIDSADVYRCIARSADGCPDTVTFFVNRVYDTTAKITYPFLNPTLCEGDSLTLRAFPPGASEFQWARNGVPLAEKTDRLIVRDSGTYSVLVRIGNNVNGCLSLATIKVGKAQKGVLQLQPKFTVCQGDSAIIDVVGFPQAEWWRLQGGKQIQILGTGTRFIAKTADTLLCIASVNGACADSAITIVETRAAPPITLRVLENRKTMCRGELLTLVSTTSGFPCRWRKGKDPLPEKNDSTTIQIDDAGTYYLTVDYGNSCARTDSVTINNGLEPPDLEALDGVAICPGATTRLTTKGKFTTYRWSTGETTDTIVVNKTGTYSVEVTLFGCVSTSQIVIEEASPTGPGLAFRDSTMICAASQYAWLVFTNPQAVPRIYNVTVLDSTTFASSTRRLVVGAKDTGSVGFRYISGDPPSRFSAFRVRLSDDCKWERELSFTVENRAKTVPLDIVMSTPPNAIKSGDNFVMRLAGSSRAGLPDFTRRDTLWIETALPPDLFEITSAKAACGDQLTKVNDKAGRVRFCLTDCATASADPLVEQALSALVGETLQGFIEVDSIYSTSPCITAPMSARRVDVTLVPYGCEITTITRTTTLIMGIGSVDNGTVTAVITRSNGPVTVRAVDVLGRILDSVIVPQGADPRTCRLDTRGEPLVYISAFDASSMVTLPVAGGAR
ncbi:MAG: DUF2341 domain-containing protein [Candidatus Kapaibacterium sp.]